MSRAPHLNDRALAALAAELRATRGAEARHLAACPRCAADLAATRTLIGRLGAGPQTVPRDLISRATLAFARRAQAVERPARRVIEHRPGASLAAPPGLRSAAPAVRQWLFASGDLEVDLQDFAETPEMRHLLGQVQGRVGALAGLPVHLQHDGPAQMAVTGRFGEFSFSGVRGRGVRLILESDNVLHRLELGPVPEPEPEPGAKAAP